MCDMTGNELSKIRKEVLRLKQSDLGALVGKGGASISRYETGLHPIPADVAIPVRVMATAPDQMIEIFRRAVREEAG